MKTADVVTSRGLGDRPIILIAEDDLATRALLRASLERAAYAVDEVDNGASALASILPRQQRSVSSTYGRCAAGDRPP